PWVPLRILGLGKSEEDVVQADAYLMTDVRPSLFPTHVFSVLNVDYDQPASDSLLDDLRSDKGMDWVPNQAWLTKIGVNADPTELTYDLAVDASGQGTPSAVDAGLVLTSLKSAPSGGIGEDGALRLLPGLFFIGSGIGLIAWLIGARPAGWRAF